MTPTPDKLSLKELFFKYYNKGIFGWKYYPDKSRQPILEDPKQVADFFLSHRTSELDGLRERVKGMKKEYQPNANDEYTFGSNMKTDGHNSALDSVIQEIDRMK